MGDIVHSSHGKNRGGGVGHPAGGLGLPSEFC